MDYLEFKNALAHSEIIVNGVLVHNGIAGQKWGVRNAEWYPISDWKKHLKNAKDTVLRKKQNEDGSLTEYGRSHYKKISSDKLAKELRKQVKNKRAEKYGFANKWNITQTIGPNSEAARKKYKDDYKKYQESPYIKERSKEYQKLEDDFDKGLITTDEEWNERETGIRNKYSKYADDARFNQMVTYTNKGRTYVDEYIKAYGSDLNIGYLKDLGYEESDIKWLNKKILKSKYKLLNGL